MTHTNADQIERAVKDRGIMRYSPRSCSICNSPLSYIFSRDGSAAAFDSRCDCGSYSEPQRQTFVDIADLFNMQTPETFAAMWADFLAQGTRKPPEPIEFGYTNYRGEYSIRRAVPVRVYFGSTEWHPEPQWLMSAFDLEKGADRDFALKDIGLRPVETAAVYIAVDHTGCIHSSEDKENTIAIAKQNLESTRRGLVENLPYQAVFNAIADAVQTVDANIGISVATFKSALAHTLKGGEGK